MQTRKTAIITGASSGIGEATAYVFATHGYNIVLAARSKEKLLAVKNECEKNGVHALAISCDVSKEADCQNLINEAVSHFGRIDVLVNNAGISMRAMFADLNLQVLKQLMDINFWGAVYCTRFAISELLKAKGSVIGVSSVAGFKGLPARTGYSASKFAMNGFMEALRIENRKTGLHVGVICPGYTASNIRKTALNAKGTSQAESPFDESKLMSAEAVAGEIFKMVKQRKAEVVLTSQGKLTKLLNKFFPRLVDKLVFNVVAKEKDSPF